MDVHDRGMLYYRLLKHNVQEARRVVCGQHKVVASKNTIIPRVSHERFLAMLFSELGRMYIHDVLHSDWDVYTGTYMYVVNRAASTCTSCV